MLSLSVSPSIMVQTMHYKFRALVQGTNTLAEKQNHNVSCQHIIKLAQQ
jgi:hypothetical protein